MNIFLKSKAALNPSNSTNHFIHQRVTAFALIPLCIWFTTSMVRVLQDPIRLLPKYIESPMNIIFLILSILLAIYHGALGMKVIIDDYVHNKTYKRGIVFMLYSITSITLIVGLITLINIHINSKVS